MPRASQSSDPFNSPKHRLRKAKNKLISLKKRWHSFAERRPYDRVIEWNPDIGMNEHKIKFTRDIPLGTRDLAWEIIENLRSALDQMAFACAKPGSTTDPKKCQFPVGDDASGLERTISGGCKDLPPDIIAFFRGLRPYRGGNDSIWVLNKLANANKHRELIQASVRPTGTVHVNNFQAIQGRIELPVPVWDPAKREMVVVKTAADAKLLYDISVEAYVAFGDIPHVAGHEVISTLQAMAWAVEDVLIKTEHECRRLRIFR